MKLDFQFYQVENSKEEKQGFRFEFDVRKLLWAKLKIDLTKIWRGTMELGV